jgi:outer membrane protein OmpA-like peptidoglycan-associated protein
MRMGSLFRGRLHPGAVVCLTLILYFFPSSLYADDCKRVPNILVLFDASGYMKDKDRYQLLLTQMSFFVKAMPVTADGFFNVGLRHYGLKVGMGCENTESILAIQPWDPEKFLNAFPKSVSYGVSSLSAGLRAAADEVASATGKSIILVIGGGIESCNADPVTIAEQIGRNNPDLEIHTFQIGNAQDGSYYLKAIAAKARGTYNAVDSSYNQAAWYAWMMRNLVTPCGPSVHPPGGAPQASAPIAPVTFDYNSFSVRSTDPVANAANLAALQAVGQALKANPSARVILHGFSDGKGKPEYNLKLSRKRAEAVAHFLVNSYGIPASQIGIVAHGASQAMLGAAAPAQERLGRRVEIEITR